jgi:glycosyltransferase domain-containing protein
MVVDSTAVSDFDNFKTIAGPLNFMYLHTPNKSVHQAMAIGISKLPDSIRYVIQTGDDDFICTNSLPDILDFLDSNLDYNAAYGRAFALGIENVFNNSLRINWCREYWLGYRIDSDNPFIRVQTILENYLNLEFAVRRKDSVLEGLRDMNSKIGTLNFSESTTLEILAVIDTVLAGKIHYIKKDYLLRGDHIDRPNRNQKSTLAQYVLTNKFKIINSYLVHRLVDLYNVNNSTIKIEIENMLLSYIERNIIFKSIGEGNNKRKKLLIKKSIKKS